MSEKRFLEYESLKDAMWKNFYREEDKWESMPEADFLDVHGGCPRHWFQLGFGAGLDAVVKADPAPHEMSAVEYARALYEMSDADLDGAFTDWSVAYHSEDFEEAVSIVEEWAKEHSEERNEE